MEFLRAVDPACAVISVGQENDYGHPAPVVLERLSELGASIYRTDELGTICCVTDGKTVQFTAEQSAPIAPAQPESKQTYIGNRNSEKFHRGDCSKLPAAVNRVYFDSYQAAMDAGFTPCAICEP